MKKLRSVIAYVLFFTMFAISITASASENNFIFKKDYIPEFQSNTEYITRAEFVDLIYSCLDDTTQKKYYINVNAFADTQFDSWYNISISSLANAGILFGNRCGKFLPDRNIKRAEAVTILDRLSSDIVPTVDYFSDISEHWAKDYINSAYAAGWLKNNSDKFLPEEYITNYEAVTLISQFLIHMTKEEKIYE